VRSWKENFRAPGEAREEGVARKGGAAGAAGAVSFGFMPVLVGTLSHPMLYFNKRQRNMIVRCGLSALGSYADYLPEWIPVYIVMGALGFICIYIYIHTFHVSHHSPPSKYILIDDCFYYL